MYNWPRFGSELLPQLPTIRLHESHELSFYHLVESHFTQYRNSCQRYLVTRKSFQFILKKRRLINLTWKIRIYCHAWNKWWNDVFRILTILAIVLKRNPEINYKAVISIEGMQYILHMFSCLWWDFCIFIWVYLRPVRVEI